MIADLLLSGERLQWDFKDVRQGNQVCLYNCVITIIIFSTPHQPIMGELCTGDWWKETSDIAHRKNRKLLCIILYTDGIRVDFHGKINLTPIMMTLGNFDIGVQRSLAGKRLLGFVPQLHEDDYVKLFKTQRYDTSSVTRLVAHSCFEWCVYASLDLNDYLKTYTGSFSKSLQLKSVEAFDA